MKLVLKDNNKYMLRFDRGEEVLACLKEFCAKEGIFAGSFSGLGAAEKITLMHYDIDTKKYSEKTFSEKLEIASLAGNVACKDGEIYLHAHGVFSNPSMAALAGHVKELTVAATCEMTLETFSGKVEREFSEGIGLNLFK